MTSRKFVLFLTLLSPHCHTFHYRGFSIVVTKSLTPPFLKPVTSFIDDPLINIVFGNQITKFSRGQFHQLFASNYWVNLILVSKSGKLQIDLALNWAFQFLHHCWWNWIANNIFFYLVKKVVLKPSDQRIKNIRLRLMVRNSL
jgi:hypothetical protein